MTKRRNRISTLLLYQNVTSSFIEFFVLGILPWYGLYRFADFWDSNPHSIFATILAMILFLILFWACLTLLTIVWVRLHICINVFKVKSMLDSNFKVVNLKKSKYNEFKFKFNVLCCYAKIDKNDTITCIIEASLYDVCNGDSRIYELKSKSFSWFLNNFEC